MMNFYIVDDDVSIIKILSNIIEDDELGEVAGYALNGEDALEEIANINPDIILVDLLMPKKDGVELVKEMKKEHKGLRFIMISQVNAKTMVGKAYDAGIEMFINKPINRIEVINVIKRIIERIEMERKLDKIEGLFKGSITKENVPYKRDLNKNIKIILNKLGILGEKGAEDILKICSYLDEQNKTVYDYKIKDLCDLLSDHPKAMEQRLRRAINKGLVNIANLGIEDFMSPIFTRYSSSIYNFQDVKAEMDRIRGKKTSGGKISIRKFIDNILLQSDIEEE